MASSEKFPLHRKHGAKESLESINSSKNPPSVDANSPSAIHGAMVERPRASPQILENGQPKRAVKRFRAEPVETTTRSSRKRPPAAESPSSTTERPSSPKDDGTQNAKSTAPRRFIPEPIETSSRSARTKPDSTTSDTKTQKLEDQQREPPVRRKFVPEPVETTTARHRRNRAQKGEEDTDSSTSNNGRVRRRFQPELIDTARGSRRRGVISPKFNVEEETGSQLAIPRHVRPAPTPAPPTNTPFCSSESVPQVHESRYSAAAIARRREKQHSYIVPELPVIPSDSSSEKSQEGGSGTASPPGNAEGEKQDYLGREGNDKLSQYMLSLAARTAERQLREQAMAAYPNERTHEPVDHFAMNDDDSQRPSVNLKWFSAEGPVDLNKFRRESAADLEWELENMRKHHQEREKAKDAEDVPDLGESKFSAAALAAKLGKVPGEAEPTSDAWQRGVGLKQMRNAASPPMLGGDIAFPFSVSPKTTRCDVDQVPVPRKADTGESHREDVNGLWSANIKVQNDDASGLWMGLCKEQSKEGAMKPSKSARSGIMTPAPETDPTYMGGNAIDKPLEARQLPITPVASHSDDLMTDVARVDKILAREKQIEEEFDDTFVTQIYNYLSLGYPSLARPFDTEISKISRIAVDELRKDDQSPDARGYIAVPEGRGSNAEAPAEGSCVRWTALKVYIHEWARQQPDMTENIAEDWGARVRRGSWAF
ncbi:MAG: hypothetical protein Q9227_005396 [Pyrenula ochraceoflavens]